MALSIRLATEDDATAVAAIYAPYVTETRISFEEAPPHREEMERRILGDRPGFYPWFVAEDDGRMIGFANSSPFRMRPAYRWTVETGIYLAAEAHGRGIGTALLAPLLELLMRQGYVAAIAGITLPNDASVALHQKLGFFHTGTYRKVGFKMSEWLDVGLWEKELAARTASPEEPRSFTGRLSPE